MNERAGWAKRSSLARIHFVAAVVVSVFLVASSSAQAGNVVVGNPLLNTSNQSTGCQGLYEEMCTFVSLELPKSAGLVQSPVDGAIVRWGLNGATHVAGYAIRALKSQGDLDFTGDGTSERVTPAGLGVESFSADLPIHAGEFVGLDVPPDGRLAMNKVPGTAIGFFGDLTDGSTHSTGSFEGEVAYFAEIQPVPKILEVAPSVGTTSGGTPVKVRGSDFRGVSTVNFGSIPATSVNVESESTLEAVAPPTTNSRQLVDVSVVTIAGPSAPTAQDRFEYIPVPTPPETSKTCTVPRLYGKRLARARANLEAAGCALGKVMRPRAPKGNRPGPLFVSSSNPAAGELLEVGNRVNLILRPRHRGHSHRR